jgi:hypothetical protein
MPGRRSGAPARLCPTTPRRRRRRRRGRDQFGDPVGRGERVQGEQAHLGRVEEPVDLAAGGGQPSLHHGLLRAQLHQPEAQRNRAHAEETPADPAASAEHVADLADQRPGRAAHRAAGEHHGGIRLAEQLRGAQAVGHHHQATPAAQFLGEVVAGGRTVQGDRVAVVHERGGGPRDRPFRGGPVAQPHFEGALVAGFGADRAAADPAQEPPGLQIGEILANGHQRYAVAPREGGNGDLALALEHPDDVGAPLVLGDTWHGSSHPQRREYRPSAATTLAVPEAAVNDPKGNDTATAFVRNRSEIRPGTGKPVDSPELALAEPDRSEHKVRSSDKTGQLDLPAGFGLLLDVRASSIVDLPRCAAWCAWWRIPAATKSPAKRWPGQAQARGASKCSFSAIARNSSSTLRAAALQRRLPGRTGGNGRRRARNAWLT